MVFQPLLRRDVGSAGPRWLPLLLVLGSIAAVAYADHLAVSISLGYLYILPLGVGAMFLRSEISYGLIVVCAFLHDLFAPPYVNWANRIAHNVSAMLAFIFVVYVIQRYMRQREQLTRSVRQQRDSLLKDVELAAEVQRMFLPLGKPAIAGLGIAGMMHPAKGIGGDYYDYIPIDEHSVQLIIADASGKGVAAALLMSATAAAVQLEVNQQRNMLQVVSRLNTSIHAVSSDGERYVTLLMAEIDARNRKLQYVNCGHNPALLFRAGTAKVTRMNSSCAPIGMIVGEPCEVVSVDLFPGDVLVFWLKNSAWSGFPPWYSAARHCPRKRSWTTSSAARRFFLRTLASAMMSPSWWSNAISTVQHNFSSLFTPPRLAVFSASINKTLCVTGSTTSGCAP
jgi:sigma-B regulation protein RsbU (phosphoserine phosphatase)